jgi:membrane protease YdiL (CAAX protease family)
MTETSDEFSSTATAKSTLVNGEPAVETAAASWEDDENRATLLLRSLVTLFAGAYLLWAQNRTGLSTSSQWPQWIWTSVICNFVLPLGIVWFFFGQGLSRLDWLNDQKYNAWNYGFSFRAWRCHLRIAIIITALLLPFMIYFSRQGEIRNFYHGYFPPAESTLAVAGLLASLVVYMFCWEWFFRGFLLFGMAQGLGPFVSIVLQALLFGAAHIGKPPEEMYSSFAGGALLGWICWREKSFAPAFYAHALIHVIWALLVRY